MTSPMSMQLNPFAAPPRLDAAHLAWNTVASYDNYPAAQSAVTRLSDKGFPVEHIDIVGSDLRLVERVIGRVTRRKAVLAMAGSGAWFGLLIGLLFAVFTTGPWFGLVVSAVAMGAVWGAVFGFLGRAGTRGGTEIASAKTIIAARYDLVARDGYAETARHTLEGAGLPTAA